jgi:hypothetical protein
VTPTESQWLWILVSAIVAAAWLLSRRQGRASSEPTPQERLLHACLGDNKQARRLVKLELEKTPGISRKDATLRALAALRRDGA